MAKLTHLTDAVQAVYIYGTSDGDEELYGILQRWKDFPHIWDLRDGDDEVIFEGDALTNGGSYERLIASMALQEKWPLEGLRIVYDTERDD